jgi:predicted  nucleic acid-binding Zn-ribbon protein
MGSELERIVEELNLLAERKPLKGNDLDRAKELMIMLREMGFTNKDISMLTGGKWSEPTVKIYTKGSSIKDSSIKDDALTMLYHMINKGLTIDDVKLTINVKGALDSKGVSLNDLLALLDEVKRSNLNLSELMNAYKAIKGSGLPLAKLNEVLSYKSMLDGLGLTVEGLREICKVSEAYGGYNGLINAIKAYDSLKAIESKVNALRLEQNKLEEHVNMLKEEVKGLEEEKSRIKDSLSLYEGLRKLGFDEEMLKGIKNLSEKYGGANSVIEAINTYGSLDDLRREVKGLEDRKHNLELELKNIDDKYSHIKSIIDICNTLIHEYKFSVQAITDIYEVAKKYGEPINILKAIEGYGELKAIEDKVKILNAKRDELEARVNELNNDTQRLRALIDELSNASDRLFNPLVSNLNATLTNIINSISQKYEEYANRYGELNAKLGKLEEELELARVIQALIKYPSELKDIPLDYDMLMLNAIINHCKVKEINPKVKIGDKIINKYSTGGFSWLTSSTELELLDILELAIRALDNYINKIIIGGKSEH